MSARSFRMELPNGWTFSLSDEMRPFICNVAAWPTEDPEEQRALDRRWFQWEDDRVDCRCISMGEVGELLQQVMAAKPPAEREA